MIPEGKYEAVATAARVYEAEKSGALMVAINLQNKTAGYESETHRVDCCLILKDGSIGEKTVANLKAIFGSDCFGPAGDNPFVLEDSTTLEGKPIIITIAHEHYNGKAYAKVKYIDPPGRASGLPKSADRAAVMAKYGAKFRAISGGAPVHAKKPATKPPGPPPAAVGPISSQDACWQAMCAEHDTVSDDELNTIWLDLLGKLFPGKTVDKLTPSDWGKVLLEIKKDELPM